MPRLGSPIPFARIVLVAALCSNCVTAASRRSLKHASSHAVCGVSQLGYQCYLQVCPSIAMHWSLGGPGPGRGRCSYPNASSTGAFDVMADTVHFALTTDLGGFVAMSLPAVIGVMAPADSIIGFWEDGVPGNAGSVQPFYLQDMHIEPRADSSVALSNTALESGSLDGGLTMCFSRPMAAVGLAGMQLSASSIVGMNFAAAAVLGSGSQLHQHAMDPGHLCGVEVILVAEAQPGGEYAVMQPPLWSPSTAVVAHAVLMLSAWLVLLPAGILAARHRWLFPAAAAVPARTAAPPATWFLVHRAAQLTGMAVFTVGFTLPWVAFGDHGSESQAAETLAHQAHRTIGITVAGLAYLQLLLAFVRPKPDAAIRKWWNWQHWFTGRVAMVLALANLVIGGKVLHDAWLYSEVYWYTALFLLLAILVAVGGVLEVRRYRRGAWQQLPAHDSSSSPTLPVSIAGGLGGYVQMRAVAGSGDELSLLNHPLDCSY